MLTFPRRLNAVCKPLSQKVNAGSHWETFEMCVRLRDLVSSPAGPSYDKSRSTVVHVYSITVIVIIVVMVSILAV